MLSGEIAPKNNHYYMSIYASNRRKLSSVRQVAIVSSTLHNDDNNNRNIKMMWLSLRFLVIFKCFLFRRHAISLDDHRLE